MKKLLFFMTLFLLGAGMSFAQNVLFVKDGVTDGEVITEGGVTGAAYTTLKAAMDASAVGDTVRLLNDVTEAATTSSGYGICCAINDCRCIDGNGYTLTVTGANTTWDCALFHRGGTFKNLTLNGAFRGIFCGNTLHSDVIIDNCVLDKLCYTISVDGSTMTAYSLIVSNSVINGWTSYSNIFKSSTYTNCDFGKGTGGYTYAFFRPFGSTAIEGSSFSSDYQVDPTKNIILFNDCDIASTPLTTDNLNDLLTITQDEPTSKTVVVNSGYSEDAEGKITGGVYGGNLAQLNQILADGYEAFALGTDPETYQVDPVYYIHFNSNGGTGTMADSYVDQTNPTFTVPDNTEFTNGSWTFDTWNTKADGTGTDLNVGDVMTLTSDTTLYAQWKGVAKIGDTHYLTLDAAAAAVLVGTPTTITILQNLNFYDIASSNLTNKTITFTGVATDTLTITTSAFEVTTASGADLTFQNITVKNDMTTDQYCGIQHLNKLTINNCEVIGFVMSYAENLICNNCTFTKTGKYHMWTYGSNCTFNSCTFNSYGNSDCKAVNVYTDQTFDMRVITFNGCAFNSTPEVMTLDNSAIQINSRYTCFVVYVNNCTVNGYINQSATAVPECPYLVNNKKEVTNTKTILYLDGVQILKEGSCDPVAKIDETYYTTLQDALDAAHGKTGDVTINIISDEINTYSVIREKNGLNLTIEGNNHKLDGQLIINGMGLGESGTGTVTIQNLNFNGDKTNFLSGTDAFVLLPKPATIPSPYNSNTYNYANHVTIDNCKFISTSSDLNVVGIKVTSNAGAYNLALTNCTGNNLHSLAQLTGTTGSSFDNCKITNSESFINVNGGKGDHNILNCTFTSAGTGGYAVRELSNSSAEINLSNNTFTASSVLQLGKDNGGDALGHINVESGTYNGTLNNAQSSAGTAAFVFTGGTFSESKAVVDSWCAPGYFAIENGPDADHCTVYQMYTLIYNANGGTGTMDTIRVKVDASVSDRTKTVADCAFLPATSTDIFAIWNTKADSTGISFNPGDPIVLNSDTTLYAIWREGYTISYDANGGTGTIPSQNKVIGVDLILSDGTDGAGNYLITKTDSTLYRWNTTPDEAMGSTDYALGGTYSADANDTLYAVWRLNLDMTTSATDVVCYHENNGTDTVKMIGGEAPFQLVLKSSVLPENDTVKNIMERTYIFQNLKKGDYTVELSDVLKKDYIINNFTIDEPDTLEITALTVPTNKPCPLMGVGSFDASVTAQGGNDPGNYTYTWGDDAEDVNADATVVPAKADDIDYTYTVTVTVTDIKACTATATATIEVSPVIVHIDSLHGNTTMKIDTIRQGVMQGCDTIIRDFGYPTFTFSNSAITVDILDTVYNDIPVNFPDSVFPVETSKIIWTAVDTCGHIVTCEQVLILYYYPCPDAELDSYTYHSVRVGCNCWLSENLRAKKYSNGRDIDNVMTYVNDAYPDETANANTYGYLYDWYAAVDTVTNSTATIIEKDNQGKRVQGACPENWYLPNEADLDDLFSIDTRDLRSTDLWIVPGGTNATGFNAVPSGYFNCTTGRFEELTGGSAYWSCHPVVDKATGAIIGYECNKITKNNNMEKCNGLSIRCILITDPQN